MRAALTLGKTPTEWLQLDALDRVLILTHLENEADKCPGCGNYLSETVVPHQVVVDEITCHRCAALEYDAEQRDKLTPGGHRYTYPAEQDPTEQ